MRPCPPKQHSLHSFLPYRQGVLHWIRGRRSATPGSVFPPQTGLRREVRFVLRGSCSQGGTGLRSRMFSPEGFAFVPSLGAGLWHFGRLGFRMLRMMPFPDSIRTLPRGAALGHPAALGAYAAGRALKEDSAWLLVHPDARSVEEIAAAARLFLGDRVFLFPPWQHLPFEPASPEPSVAAARIEALAALTGALLGTVRNFNVSFSDICLPSVRQRPGAALVVATAAALARRTFSPDLFSRLVKTFSYADEISPQEVARFLVSIGYRRVVEVNEAGEFALRGGIMDVASPGAPPVRLLWDDNLIEMIRLFDLETQRSSDSLDSVTFLPAREIRIPTDAVERDAAAARIAREVAPSVRRDRFLEELREGNLVEGLELFLPFLAETACLLDFSRGRTIVVDPACCRERIAELFSEAAAEAAESDVGYDPRLLWERNLADEDTEILSTIFSFEGSGYGAEERNEIETEPLPPAPLDSGILRVDLKRLTAGKDEIVIGSALPERTKDLVARVLGDSERVRVVKSDLLRGCRIPEWGLVLVGDGDLYGHRTRHYRGRRKRAVSMAVLNPGDYVVHRNHGVGIFRGIERIRTMQEERDVILIEYAGGDRLYLPPYETEMLERYSIPEGTVPRLDKLGSVSWSKLRARVEKETAAIARELIDLYALRSAGKGVPLPEAEGEDEFVEAFGYDETPDQAAAIEAVLQDLEKSELRNPMDRLVCGDVGFGKTEVALRAVFRTVRHHRQAAVLCPTTVLALQHGRSFRERLGPFGIRVEVLSRFESGTARKRILKGLSSGEIPVVIGTHALLGKNVRFRDLGLVVIDEEQRFGVRHKERLKALRKHVDVLTLSATPIPRTLHMALSGVRSLSIIETPPPGRAAVQTIVEPFNPEHIRRAIRRELERDGQVFYVHNRIETLDRIGAFLKEEFSGVEIALAHGRLPEEELAETMTRFLDGEIRILVSTSIIENGLDIPRANTLIVDGAERFGLAQLYQLRGRVGRSTVRAYAYFFYSSDGALTPEARSRLAAIAEHTALGSGYAVARRDMEIRGAGEILGTAQHGSMEAVGYEMYCRLLREALAELKGEKREIAERLPPIDIGITAFIPVEWVGGEELIGDLHRLIASQRTITEVEGLREELIDRFGTPPPPVENLLELARLRIFAAMDGVESVVETREGLEIRWKRLPEDFGETAEAYRARFFVFFDPRRRLFRVENPPPGEAKLTLLRRLLRR
ncbi:MAG: transcription-repair coupling factor [Candidatus Hydrogenedentota bacterium]|nr:MAG: transcription-repair coupling factor [Candidatus Hydrogenedentota bacterium]